MLWIKVHIKSYLLLQRIVYSDRQTWIYFYKQFNGEEKQSDFVEYNYIVRNY